MRSAATTGGALGLWFREAEINKVLPLNDLPVSGKDLRTFLGLEFEVLAEVTTTAGSAGVIFSHGSRFGGHALYVEDGTVRYTYNVLGIPPEQRLEAPAPAPGKHIIGVDFRISMSKSMTRRHCHGTDDAAAALRRGPGRRMHRRWVAPRPQARVRNQPWLSAKVPRWIPVRVSRSAMVTSPG